MPSPRRALPDRSAMSLATDRPDVQQIALEQIRADGGTQMRAGLDEQTVAEYRDWLRDLAGQPNGLGSMPPLVVYYDGTDYWLADGFHRLAAWKTAGFAAGPVSLSVQAEVKPGTRRDAILYAAKANTSHGLRRTPADKWRAVEALLVDEEWGAWSDRKIAETCSVSPTFVGQVRAKLGDPDRPQYAPPPLPVTVHVDSDKRTYTTRHGTVAVMDTSKIGQRQEQERKPDVWERRSRSDIDFGNLTTVPPHDGNFRYSLEHADLDTLHRALAWIPDAPGHKERKARLEARIRKLEQEQPPQDADPTPPRQLVDYMTVPADSTPPDVEAEPTSLDSVPVQDSTDPAKPITKQQREQAKQNAARIERLEHLQSLYRAVLDTLSTYEQDTGLYTHTPAMRRAAQLMLETVDRNLAALRGDEGEQQPCQPHTSARAPRR